MNFSRKQFFDGVKQRIDPTLKQEQVDGLEFLLNGFETDDAWPDVRHVAYALATIFHETAGSFQPVEEGYYLGSSAKVAKFQKTLRYYPYFGRGYVQLTWKANYAKAGAALGIDLVNKPELALDRVHAFQILTLGLFRGWFGGKLTTYINDKKTDYVNARRCVNVLDKAGLIAGYATSFEKVLRNSAAVPAADNRGSVTETGDDTSSATNSAATPPIVPTPVAAVPALSAAPSTNGNTETKTPEESTLTKIGNKANTIYLTFGTMIAGVVAWFSNMAVPIVIAIMGAVVLLGAIYLLTTWGRALIRDAADRKDKRREAEREFELKKLREAHTQEAQMYSMQSVADPGLNAVTIANPPATEMPNADSQAQEA